MVKRVCLISPGHVAFNPRLVKEAGVLSAAGYAVHVIAANNLEYLRPLDEPILQSAGWSFELVGGKSQIFGFFRRGRTKLAKTLLSISKSTNLRLNEYAHHSLTEPLKAAAIRHRAELYIAHYVAAIPAAHRAAIRHASIWGFDAEDYHLGQYSRHELDSVDARAVSTIEKTYFPYARHFTASSEGIAEAYKRNYSISLPQVVKNVFSRCNAPMAPTKAGWARPGPSVYWFSQTIGSNRGLECAVRAIALASSKPHLHLRGNLQPGIKERLSELAIPLGVSDRIHYLPPVPGADLEKLAAEYDIGLVGEPGNTPNNGMALANKLFSFLLAGLPVVASDTPAHRALAQVCEAIMLYPAESADGLAKVLDVLLLRPANLERARALSWMAGQHRYNWELEQKKLIQAVCAQIGPPKADE